MGFKHWEEILFPGRGLTTMTSFFLLTSLHLRWKLVEISGFVGNGSKEVEFFSRRGWNYCTTSRKQTSLLFVGKRNLGIDAWAEKKLFRDAEFWGPKSEVQCWAGAPSSIHALLHGGKRSALACGTRWQCSELTLNLISWHLGGYYTVWSSQQSRWYLCFIGKRSCDQSITVPTETRFFSPNVF